MIPNELPEPKRCLCGTLLAIRHGSTLAIRYKSSAVFVYRGPVDVACRRCGLVLRLLLPEGKTAAA